MLCQCVEVLVDALFLVVSAKTRRARVRHVETIIRMVAHQVGV